MDKINVALLGCVLTISQACGLQTVKPDYNPFADNPIKYAQKVDDPKHGLSLDISACASKERLDYFRGSTEDPLDMIKEGTMQGVTNALYTQFQRHNLGDINNSAFVEKSRSRRTIQGREYTCANLLFLSYKISDLAKAWGADEEQVLDWVARLVKRD